MKGTVNAPVHIGDVALESRHILAPLAGMNDVAFRELCRENGAGLVFTGMLHSDSFEHTSLVTSSHERPLAIQIVGVSPERMGKAARMLSSYADILDINMGCPSPTITKSGAGGALLKEHELALRIVKAVVNESRCPVTVKMRAGFESRNLQDTIALAKGCAQEGAKAVTLHPRSVRDGYSGSADWGMIAQLVRALDIPVIGNGDIRTSDQAGARLVGTGCAAVMIGRAAMGHPMIFSGEPATADTQRTLFLRYWKRIEQVDDVSLHYLRMQALNFFRGFHGARQIRRSIAAAKTINELHHCLTTFEY